MDKSQQELVAIAVATGQLEIRATDLPEYIESEQQVVRTPLFRALRPPLDGTLLCFDYFDSTLPSRDFNVNMCEYFAGREYILT